MPPAPPPSPCVFFDRDGIVNQSPGPGYVNHLDDFHILPGFADCVRAAAAKGFPSVLVTNQRGISRGITPPDQLDAMHRHLQAELAKEGRRSSTSSSAPPTTPPTPTASPTPACSSPPRNSTTSTSPNPG